MWVRQQAEIPILIEGSLEGVASPHHRTVAHVQQIVIADHLAGVNTSMVPWRKPDRREARVNRVMLRKGSHGHSSDGAENLQPERHLSADVGVNGRTHCEMQSDLVTERVNPAYVTNNLAPEGVVKMAVHQNEEGGLDPGGVLQFGHLQRVTGRKVNVVAKCNVAPWQPSAAS